MGEGNPVGTERKAECRVAESHRSGWAGRAAGGAVVNAGQTPREPGPEQPPACWERRTWCSLTSDFFCGVLWERLPRDLPRVLTGLGGLSAQQILQSGAWTGRAW